LLTQEIPFLNEKQILRKAMKSAIARLEPTSLNGSIISRLKDNSHLPPAQGR